MSIRTAYSPEVSHRALMFGLLGGAIAWVAHLLAAYAIAEWGCVSGALEAHVLGIAAVAWVLIAVSVVTLLAALAATWVAYRLERRLRPQQGQDAATKGEGLSTARLGLYLSGIFAFIILVESVPIFYFLRDCSHAMSISTARSVPPGRAAPDQRLPIRSNAAGEHGSGSGARQ